MIPIGRMVLLADTAHTRTTKLAAIIAPMTPITVRALRSASFFSKPVLLRTPLRRSHSHDCAPLTNVAYASACGHHSPRFEYNAAIPLRRAPAQVLHYPPDLSAAPAQESKLKLILE